MSAAIRLPVISTYIVIFKANVIFIVKIKVKTKGMQFRSMYSKRQTKLII